MNQMRGVTVQAFVGMAFLAVLLLGVMILETGCNKEQAMDPSDAASTSTAAITADPDAIERGRVLYTQYCVNCHDPEAEGYGDAVGNLTTLPANLTELSINNNGEFPVERVHRFVDGREEVVDHGPREMPVWGNVWTEETANDRINEIVAYLQSIQKTN